MTLNTMIGVGIGVVFGWRIGIIVVRVWRAWAQHKALAQVEKQRQLLLVMRMDQAVRERAMQSRSSHAPGYPHKRVG